VKKHTILICDDEDSVRASLAVVLRKDYSLKFAKNAMEAIDAIRENAPDLVILDIKMPKIDGLYALKEIKKIAPGLGVIMLSGYRSIEVARAATKRGAADYIIKPLNPEHILSSVKRVLHSQP